MRLLIIGSPTGPIKEAGQIAHSKGAHVTYAETVTEAMKIIRAGHSGDLAMIDVVHDVSELIKSLEQEHISLPVVACGIEVDSEAAVNAIKSGAKEYIPMPPDAELIAAVLQAITDNSKSFIFNDESMKKVIELADRVAPSDASILVTGESGTGKEVMANYIHSKSKRASKSFVSVNCAAIPENLLESELFGHEKGAFTGAVSKRVGKFEAANGGTLLLDEISEMDPRLQAKLLRAIQEREIDRVGGTKPVKVDIRLIATSNRDLAEAVKEGVFREDLYFRLNVFHFDLPPLRKRPNDVDILSKHFVKKYSELNGLKTKPIAKETLEMLQSHSWPGNVRELENTMHRAILLEQENSITPDAIMFSASSKNDESSAQTAEEDDENSASFVGKTVANVEQDLIIDTLKHCLGNRTHASHMLGISIRTLRNKLRLYSEEGVNVPPAS